MKEYFEYVLKSPVIFNHNGVEEQCTALKIYSPEKKQEDSVLSLCQYISSSIMESTKHASSNRQASAEEATKQDIDGKTILTLLMSSSNDVKTVMGVFRRTILSAGTVIQPMGATLNSESMFNMFSIEDKLNLLGEYLANFIISLVTPE